jgi:hypothetical protein
VPFTTATATATANSDSGSGSGSGSVFVARGVMALKNPEILAIFDVPRAQNSAILGKKVSFFRVFEVFSPLGVAVAVNATVTATATPTPTDTATATGTATGTGCGTGSGRGRGCGIGPPLAVFAVNNATATATATASAEKLPFFAVSLRFSPEIFAKSLENRVFPSLFRLKNVQNSGFLEWESAKIGCENWNSRRNSQKSNKFTRNSLKFAQNSDDLDEFSYESAEFSYENGGNTHFSCGEGVFGVFWVHGNRL